MLNRPQDTHKSTFPLFLEDRLSNLLLQMDGSTTRILMALVGGALTVDLKHQEIIPYHNMPEDVRLFFSGAGPFIHRVTSLRYQGERLSDNAVFADVSLLTPEIREELSQGKIPLGLLIANMEYRRQFLESARMGLDKLRPLFTPVALPSGEAPVKKYLIMRDRKCWFYICEVFHPEKITKCFLDEKCYKH